MGKGIKALIFGGAVGAAIGVLYAPRAGKKTRALLAQKTDALWGQEAQDKGTILGEVAKTTKTAVEAGQDIFNEAQKSKFGDFTRLASDRGQKWFKETSAVVEDFTKENVRPVFAEKNDELRKKIDNARAKIASQVSQNISNHEEKSAVNPPMPSRPAVKSSATSSVTTSATKKPATRTTKKSTTTKATKKPATKTTKRTTAKKSTTSKSKK